MSRTMATASICTRSRSAIAKRTNMSRSPPRFILNTFFVVLAIQLTAIYQCGPTLRYIFESIDRNVNDRQLKQKVASSSPAYEVTSSRVSYSQSAEQHRLCTDGLDGDE